MEGKVFMFGFAKKKKSGFLALVDCSDASVQVEKAFPCTVGGGKNSALRIEGVPDLFSVSENSSGRREISTLDVSSVSVRVNGMELASPTDIDSVATLQVGERLFYLISDPETLERAKRMDVSKWLVFYAESGRIEDEVPFARIRSSVTGRGLSGVGIAICPSNFEIGFMFTAVFGGADDKNGALQTVPMLSESAEAVTCPMCWLKFDLGDAMSIAVHESLRGDPLLGPDEMMRFLPTVFNDDGVPLDAAGMPCPDIACPHCRKKLPPNCLDMPQKIFSIVGAPSSGKSYYLSVLIKRLQERLYGDFSVVFKDLDPTGNMLLTQMKNKLFSARRPEEAILAKTALEGAMYERYPRHGKMVALPKPMTYSISKGEKTLASLVFYDNAGEHFEPGLDIEESPGAMHVASSSAIFFLFDPASNRNFKIALGDYPDPQLTIEGRLDQQDTILSEMEVRIKRILSIEPSRRIKTPIAVLLGKCDMWMHLLSKPLEPVISGGILDLGAVDRNSEILRDFMMSIDSSVPISAMSISDNVRFFAVSALGHSPQVIREGEFAGKIAPIPEKLNPIDVEIPTIWALSLSTDIIPTRGS